jgi:AcrR family transcriptional regulator
VEADPAGGPATDASGLVLDAADRLFFALGFSGTSMDDLARDLGMSKKTIYRYYPGKRALLAAVLDRQFARVERALTAAAESAAGRPFAEQVASFLVAAGSELSRIGAPQLLWGRGDPMLRPYVEQRVEDVVYRRVDALFAAGHERGLLPTPPELLSVITRGALERLLESELPRELDRSAADLLQATIDVVLHGALRPAGGEAAPGAARRD